MKIKGQVSVNCYLEPDLLQRDFLVYRVAAFAGSLLAFLEDDFRIGQLKVKNIFAAPVGAEESGFFRRDLYAVEIDRAG